VTEPIRTFRFSYGVFRPLLSILGMGPAFTRIELTGDRLLVRFGWGFRADVPLSSISAAAPHGRAVGGIGVHGWRGRWLVNGSVDGLVTIDIDPPARGFVLLVPVRLGQLTLSLEDRDSFLAALGRPPSGG